MTAALLGLWLAIAATHAASQAPDAAVGDVKPEAALQPLGAVAQADAAGAVPGDVTAQQANLRGLQWPTDPPDIVDTYIDWSVAQGPAHLTGSFNYPTTPPPPVPPAP